MSSNFFAKLLVLLLFFEFAVAQQRPENKPFTRWWWMGSAVNMEGIKYNIEAFHKAGLGGVEITPIYGVKGQEENYIPYLSAHWLQMLAYTTHLADSLGMKVDMVLGTGWPYGGPHVEPEFAATNLAVDSFEVAAGINLIRGLRHTKPNFKLMEVLAFDKNNRFEDLKQYLNGDRLAYHNTGDTKMIYAIYAGKTGQKVKRAAPGGEGFTVDHYSKSAFDDYVKPFNEALKAPIRAIFNDSYEVYETDFTPEFFKEFEKRRGYDLKPYLYLMIKKENSIQANRIRADYRETLSDLLKENFDRPWTNWAHQKGYKTKLQAHGSPGNLLDLYATADIPECETFGSMPFDIPGFRREPEDIREGDADPVMLKFSSSAAHMTGKPLVSSETFTWLRDHFKTALSQTKPELEELFLNGVNHVFLHGSTYSPPTAVWPGWKFYASVNFSPQMPIWNDADGLFSYIKNCQTILQDGQPDNEIAVYWPVYDTYHSYLKGALFFQFKIHSLQEWLLDTPFYRMSQMLMKSGYSIDFMSDDFLQKAKIVNGQIQFEGASFKAIVIPETKHIPLKTMEKLMELKNAGANVIFESKPASVAGFYDWESQERTLQSLTKDLETHSLKLIPQVLTQKGIFPETLVSNGLKFVRRTVDGQKVYYIVNHSPNDFEGFLPLNALGNALWIYDPLLDQKGQAEIKTEGQKTLIKIQLKAGASVFVGEGKAEKPWSYFEKTGSETTFEGPFKLSFLEGGPNLPKSHTLKELQGWEKLGTAEAAFSGRAAYECTFDRPKGKADAWLLKLPEVRESARIYLNDKHIGTLWANPFEIRLDKLQKKNNRLRIEVSNLAANRIKAKEEAGEEWKIFHEINMVDKDYKPFDAKAWDLMPSGLIGDLKLIGLKKN